VYHSQSQGLAERHNRELKHYLENVIIIFLSQKEMNDKWNLPLD